MNQHPYIALGQKVVYVGSEKNHKGTITAVYNPDSARIEWEDGAAIADYSNKPDAGTFHFEQQASLKSGITEIEAQTETTGG